MGACVCVCTCVRVVQCAMGSAWVRWGGGCGGDGGGGEGGGEGEGEGEKTLNPKPTHPRSLPIPEYVVFTDRLCFCYGNGTGRSIWSMEGVEGLGGRVRAREGGRRQLRV